MECRPRKPAPGGGARRWVTRAWQGQAASDTRPQGSPSPAPTDEWTNRARCPHVCLFTAKVSSETPPQPPRTAPVWRSLWPPGHEQGRTRDLPTWNLLSPCFPGATRGWGSGSSPLQTPRASQSSSGRRGRGAHDLGHTATTLSLFPTVWGFLISFPSIWAFSCATDQMAESLPDLNVSV